MELSPRSRDAGIITLAMIGLISLVAVGAADGAAYLQARVRAVTAADAAVLAAAEATTWIDDSDPVAEAERVASANGARVVECRCEEARWTIHVTVEVESRAMFLAGWNGRMVRHHAAAEAERWVRSWTPP